MEKEITVTNEFPSSEEIVFDQLGSIIGDSIEFEQKLDAYFKPLPKQKEVIDKIFSSLTFNFDDPTTEVPNLLYLGSLGGGKSQTLIYCALKAAARFPGIVGVCARETYQDLYDTFVPDLRTFLIEAQIDYKESTKNALIVLPGNSILLFRSHDRPGKLGSLQIGFFIIEEADTVSEFFFDVLLGRRRQKVPCRFGLLASNPPNEDHWLYTRFVREKKDNYYVYHAHIDENPYLDAVYVSDVKITYADSPSLYRRYIEGRWGASIRGFPVFKNVFFRKTHVALFSLPYEPDYPVTRIWDYGFVHPFFLCYQLIEQRMFFLKEYMGKNILLKDFINKIFMLCNEWFPEALYEDFVDPSGEKKSDLQKQTRFDIMRDEGIIPKFTRTSIEYKLTMCELQLTRLVKGQPVIQISPDCRILVDCLESGYVMGEDGKPVDDGYYEHAGDCFGYGIVNKFKHNQENNNKAKKVIRKVPKYNISSNKRNKARRTLGEELTISTRNQEHWLSVKRSKKNNGY